MKMLCLSMLLGVSLSMNAQDPEFSQFYANPLNLNPAMAGTNICPRLTMNYRNQWPGLSGTFKTMSVGFDKMVMDNVGLGILVDADKAGRGVLSTYNIHGIYAYHQRISHSLSFSFGLQGSYRTKSIDKNLLVFPDQFVDFISGFGPDTQEDLSTFGTSTTVDFSTGMLLYSKAFYVGGSAHHLFEPNESLIEGNSKLPIKYSFHGGLNIQVDKESMVSPNIFIRTQQDFRQIYLGMYAKKGPLTGGLWYRNGDAMVAIVGVEQNGFKCGYSYDLTLSKLRDVSAGAHELSIAYLFVCKPKTVKYRKLVCPSF